MIVSMEGTSEAKKHSCEKSGKKSKKGLIWKHMLETDQENAAGINELPNVVDAVLNETGSEIAQVPPIKKRKKKSKVLEDVKVVVQGLRENAQENGEVTGVRENTQDDKYHGTLKKKKHRKSKVELSDMTSVQAKEVSEKDGTSVQGDEKIEEKYSKKPSDTTWVQTATWKSLVGETGRVTFSLGSMLCQNSDLQMGTKISSTSVASAQASMDVLSSNNVSAWIEDSSSALLLERSTRRSGGESNSSHVKDTWKLSMKLQAKSDAEHRITHSVKTLEVAGGRVKSDHQKGKKEENADSPDFLPTGQIDDQSNGEKVCRFMRSENYEQEWLDAKRAVKNIFKRTRKDALRSMKMFHKKQKH